ncbi:hypothetical protein LUZ60_005374 [Juncus effusus]|nr:hypothetical protein LUZ60_005374 [Juncus effusus]
MDSSSGGAAAPQRLAAEAVGMLSEGVSLVLGRWTGLQMAVAEQWGGRESRRKADELAADILSWFTQTKPPLYIDDLEELIDQTMIASFNAEIEDGSIEEIAEELMLMHEDCLKGNYESIQKLKQLGPQTNSVSQSQLVVNEGDDDDESSDESESDSMAIDESAKQSDSMNLDPSRSNNKPVSDPDGWTVVANKRNRGKRSN